MASEPLPGFLDDGELNTFTLRKRNPGLSSFAEGEDISQPCCKLMSCRVLDVDCLEASLMLLTVLNHTNTPSVSSSSHHHNIADIKLDGVHNLVLLQVELDGVIRLDEWVRVTDGATIVCVQVRNTLLSDLDSSNLAKLKLNIEQKKKQILLVYIHVKH